jgi:hypothetical protein
MTEREILNRIIGPDATLADVEAAFTGDRAPEYPNYTMILGTLLVDCIMNENSRALLMRFLR